jgi:hypothetical protein
MEALESVPLVPLPARFGFWGHEDGVAVDVVARGDPSAARRWVGDSLEAYRVPLTRLRICHSRDELEQAYPLRADLTELGFGVR